MTMADELAYITVVELAGRIRRREVSPVEVVEATIERIEARNPSLNALVYLGFDDARASFSAPFRSSAAGARTTRCSWVSRASARQRWPRDSP